MPQAFFSEDPPFNAYFPTPAPTQQAQVGLPFNAPWGGGSGAPIPTPTHPTQHPTLPPLPPSPDDDDDPEFQQKKERYFELMDASVTWARENPGQKVDKEVIQSVANEVFALIEYFRLQRDPGWNDKNLFDVKDGSLKFLTFLDILPKGESQNFTLEYIRRFLQKERLSWHEFKQLVDSDDHSIHWHLGFGKVNNDLRNKFRGAINTMDGNEENQPPASNHSAHHPTGTHHPNGAHHHNVQRHNFAERAAAAAASRYNNKPTAQEPNIQYFPFRPPPVPEGGFNFADPTHPTNGETLDPLGSRLPYAFAAGGGGRGEEERNSTRNDRMSTDSLQGEDDIPEAAKLVFGNNVFVDQQQQQAPPEASTQATTSTLDSVPAAPVPPPAPFVAAAATASASERAATTAAVPPPASVVAPATARATEAAAPAPPFVAAAAPATATQVLRTPKSGLYPSSTSRTLQLSRTQLFSTTSRAPRRYNTPGRFTTDETPLKTPLPTTNLNDVKSHLMTASRGESIIETFLLEDAESAKLLASFGKNDDKLDTQTLMDLRRCLHPLHDDLSNERSLKKLIEKIDKEPMYVLEVASRLSQLKENTGAFPFIDGLESQVRIVQAEQDEVLVMTDQFNQMNTYASDKTAELIEQSSHDTEVDVQKLENEKEELDRQRKEIDRKIKELRGAHKRREETLRHNNSLNTKNAGKYEKNLIERNTFVKKENARRLAIPLAWRKCDQMAVDLLKEAIELKNPVFDAGDAEREQFQKHKDDFLRFLALVKDGHESLIEDAFQVLYGESSG